MSENYLSVSQLSNYVKNIFEAEYLLQGICVYGEISSWNVSGGNAYFTLKDENALLNCVMFGSRGQVPVIGDIVLVFGSMQYYAKGGRLTFNASKIEPYGKGLLYENFLKLKQKLGDLGYFDDMHKKTIPQFVKRIGVVTSETGAVIQDIRDVTHRRNETIDIVLYPVKVQGVGAEVEIAKGIKFFSSYPDVDCVIVARGGGSAEDLQAFNTEIVATATYNCEKPIISAVGHETDFTIIDFVSDLRAPTPSAAAELVVWKKSDVVQELLGYISVIGNRISVLQDQASSNIRHQFTQMQLIANENINCVQNYILNAFNRISVKIDNVFNEKESILKICQKGMEMLNPELLLGRGYAIITKNGQNVGGITGLNSGESVKIIMKDGSADAEIKRVEEK